MSRRFTRFACIDWSGARTERLAGIAVAICGAGRSAPRLVAGPHPRWSRADVLDWLLAQVDERAPEGALVNLIADPPGQRLYETVGFRRVGPEAVGMTMTRAFSTT